MTPRITVAETRRLLPTRPHPDDAAAVFAVHGDPETNRYNPHGPMRSAEEGVEFLRTMIEDWERDGIGYCSVASREDPSHVFGFAGTQVTRRLRPDGMPVFNLYYRFAPIAWGRGLAREAVDVTLALARRTLPTMPIVAVIDRANVPSRTLAGRVGFLPSDAFVDKEGRDLYLLPQDDAAEASSATPAVTPTETP
ncbi:GNAT family N-acetyltransferase [Embleya sp. NBC_00888]|uniref:GNAT family N-acetyltransferase n=1 Tax=Embleya sp. NBC_00888 TaxID=2975960 RepID=UPI00386E41A7|nr:GNAT family N-acetyltransferase [Embleya sp. NBC_00888]